MKVGSLVKISCTCGEAPDEEPLIGVVVQTDSNHFVEVLVRGIKRWMPDKDVEIVT